MVKIIATTPKGVKFPVINNNSPFDRQRKIVTMLRSQGHTIIDNSTPISWQDLITLGIHDSDYIWFIAKAYDSFKQDLYHKDFNMTVNGSHLLVPCNISRHKISINTLYPYKNIGCYANDMLTPIFEGLDLSVTTAVDDAISGVNHIIHYNDNDDDHVVAVIPCHPGHHSGYRNMSGFCYFNNAMAAYMQCLKYGFKPALLDLDFHAGDGSDDIARKLGVKNVRSIHIDPHLDYPFYVSEDFDNRLCFTGGTTVDLYIDMVKTALTNFITDDTNVLILAFGSDTYCKDPEVVPQYQTCINIDDYVKIATAIKDLWGHKRILVIQEGGYSDMTDTIFSTFLSHLY